MASAIAWSRIDSPSRAEPSAARAIIRSASASASTPSVAHTFSNSAVRTGTSIRRRSKRWQRDSTVTGICRISVVAKMNFTCSGGSSSVFRSPLKAGFESMCTSSMMYTL